MSHDAFDSLHEYDPDINACKTDIIITDLLQKICLDVLDLNRMLRDAQVDLCAIRNQVQCMRQKGERT